MPLDPTSGFPLLLSMTRVFADTRSLIPNSHLVAYELNVPFWSDGAEKRRWVALPNGQSIHFVPNGEWVFPIGTVFVKHFELARRRIETRLLVRGKLGTVFGASYRWRPDQIDAEIVPERRIEALVPGNRIQSRPWCFPGPDDCKKCHLPEIGGVLGVNTRQLNLDLPGETGNQLLDWSRRGLLTDGPGHGDLAALPRLPQLAETGSAAEKAKAFLDTNCGYCHRPGGATADFDARWETPLEKQGLINAPARINLGIDGARQVAPNDPWRSMILQRVETTEATKMPPLVHEEVDRDGSRILREWIATLPGPTVVVPPAIEPKGGEFSEPVSVSLSHRDPSVEFRYTLDGSPPASSSPLWTGPLVLRQSTTLRARAYKVGCKYSVIVQETFVVGN
ncbi:MAG: chitobiase/beta-hexosaminidase C-terminal domain-containing protein [Gemmataceae bacterium]